MNDHRQPLLVSKPGLPRIPGRVEPEVSPFWSNLKPTPVEVSIVVDISTSTSETTPAPPNEPPVYDFRQFCSVVLAPNPGASTSSREQDHLDDDGASGGQSRPFLSHNHTSGAESRPSLLLSDNSTSDGSSILSYSSASSLSTVKGLGMVSGRLIKALGRRTLEAAENLNIRRRLAAIRNMVQSKPAGFWTPAYTTASEEGLQTESKEALDALDDLQELARPAYPKDIQITAIQLRIQIRLAAIRDMVRSKPDDFYALGCAKESRESLLQNARWQEILNAIDDLRQLLQPEYPQVIRETALQLKWDIADICQRPVKFVVLGSGCAGKTTFVESLSSVINQQSGRSSYIASIWECLIRGLEDVWSLNSKPNTYIHIWSPQPAITGEFQPDPWRDGAFSLRYLSVITRMSQWLQDIQFEFPPHYRYLQHYLTPDSLARMFSRDYRPSKKDILSLSIRTTGIHQHVFPKFVLTDTGGQRSERKKWIHAFPRAYAVVFVASLCGDEEELLEAADVDSMAESLAIWQAILSAPRFFRSTDFILVLTKADILLDRAQRDGGDSLEKRIKTIMDQYIGVWNVETTRRGLNRSLHTHVVDQMQTTDIKAVLNTLEGLTNRYIQSEIGRFLAEPVDPAISIV